MRASAEYSGLLGERPVAPQVEEAVLREELAITLHQLPEFFAGEAQLEHLSFLFRPYKPAYYYWEVVESARRLVLGAMLVVIFRSNELSQVAFGLAAAVAVALFHARLHPYREPADNRLAFAANVVVALTFFVGTLLLADADEGRYDGAKFSFGAALITLNLLVVLLGVKYIVNDRFGVTVRGAVAKALERAGLLCCRQAREAKRQREAEAEDEEVELADVTPGSANTYEEETTEDGARAAWARAASEATAKKREQKQARGGRLRAAPAPRRDSEERKEDGAGGGAVLLSRRAPRLEARASPRRASSSLRRSTAR